MQENRPDRLVNMTTAAISIAYYGMLIGAIGVLAGLPLVKLVAPESPDWTISLSVPVTLLDADTTVRTAWGDARLEVQDVAGSLRLPVSMLPWGLFLIIWLLFATAMSLMLFFLHNLRRICQRVRDGVPFDALNAVRLRRMGLSLLALATAGVIAERITTAVVRNGLASGTVSIPQEFSFDPSAFLFALVLLVLATVFRRGAELEEEQSLTV